ncbi:MULTISPECIES: DUF2017 domain-containing protein [Streptomyces]|uniref:DUF2017 domain-containing protein n=2 Tax=Streptomyces TaxID=1883 RepID=A0A3M8F7Y7_9ACTN|nr:MULTISPECIES: DUF2017 domain-containing protein [Streptomyces]KNE82177.1 hypothetical protein ADZ36_12680 [Streptomyces fradiae]OFA39761.1 hypothetical protein BEN35_26620 [Streptomyces fradiae]PQM22708.1 DUF2017 domain-containing protein [Streptomyces xinghaiensis]RKM97877.1 DUF2017 domain-containing protein [Streptomyces xinghaiensis]RNC73986.1 DUF2017 domain-containing protein [Streptomyces xinghaiensis]
MPGVFEAVPGGGAAVTLDPVEVSILRSLTVQLLELVGPGDEPADGADPLDALFADGPSDPPSDPALARLFPDAYGDPEREPGGDEEKIREYAAEFRRYTENDLRTRKREDALGVVRALDRLPAPEDGEALLELGSEETRKWLGTLNDLRLAIGARLEVTEDDQELYRLPDSDPRKPMVMAYLWLGGLQESLIGTFQV